MAARRRRHHGPDTLVLGFLALVVVLAVFKFLADHPVLVVVAVLVAAAAVALVVRRKVQARRQHGRLLAARASIAHYVTMTPREFEHALAYLCRRDGCTDVRVVGGAGDLGADVIAVTPSGQRMVIQAKRYGPANKVGSPELQKVGGTARQIHGAQLVAAVTTSRFTRPAADYARQVGIGLFDHDALARWASRTGPAPWH
ncbi:restriction endonuclease [Streptomyces sp. NPDC092296]|uniref:restriction endonuclease n=1 Tax=Streptomyces sp. NPDC092296 TaxID=3366012 RepID=UPI0037F2659A